MNWQPMESAPEVGPQVLAAARHTKAVHYVWPSELMEKASNGELYFKAWARVIHPDGVRAVDPAQERAEFEAAMEGEELDFTLYTMQGCENSYSSPRTQLAYFAWRQGRSADVRAPDQPKASGIPEARSSVP